MPLVKIALKENLDAIRIVLIMQNLGKIEIIQTNNVESRQNHLSQVEDILKMQNLLREYSTNTIVLSRQ